MNSYRCIRAGRAQSYGEGRGPGQAAVTQLTGGQRKARENKATGVATENTVRSRDATFKNNDF